MLLRPSRESGRLLLHLKPATAAVILTKWNNAENERSPNWE